MKADHLSYKHATGVSLLGLALQLVLGLSLLVYAVLAADHAALTGALLVLAGSAVWLTLAVIFDQHRRERVEAMEAESLAALQARQTTVFEENADDLRVAAKRLAWMYTFLTPVVSLGLAAALIGVGLWRFSGGRLRFDQGVVPQALEGWAIAVGLALGVTGFIFARYVWGMAKQPVWAILRAGAAQAVGAAIIGLAIAVSRFANHAGFDAVLHYLPMIFPIIMVVLGVEIVFNFLLAMYRPRKAGERPRPAFESWMLGFIAAPDRLAESIGGAVNYQFGYDVTSGWMYRLLSRSLVLLVVAGVIIVWLMTTMAIVAPNERGLRLRNGQLVSQTDLQPGLYFKLPWPFETIERYRAAEARRLDLAKPAPQEGRAILWTNEHGHDEAEHFVFVRPPTVGGAQGEEEDLTASVQERFRDLGLVSVEVPVYYVVEDLQKFDRAFVPATREGLLRAIGQRELLTYLATVRLDDLLGQRRATASQELARRIQARFHELDAGVRVLSAGIAGVHPPTETAAMFEQVVRAERSMQGNIEQAQGERIASLSTAAGNVQVAERVLAELARLDEMQAARAPEAEILAQRQTVLRLMLEGEGSAAATIRQAQADRWTKHMGERGRLEQYRGQLASYHASPSIFKSRYYFDTLKDVMSKSRVYIVVDDSQLEIRTNLEDSELSGNALSGPRSDDE